MMRAIRIINFLHRKVTLSYNVLAYHIAFIKIMSLLKHYILAARRHSSQYIILFSDYLTAVIISVNRVRIPVFEPGDAPHRVQCLKIKQVINKSTDKTAGRILYMVGEFTSAIN